MAVGVDNRNRNSVTLHAIMRRPAGMTLVELLVVLGMIAVLAAITFPVFRYGIVSVQRSACLSNVRQITMSLDMYSDDYDRTFPSFRVDPASAVHADDYVYWYNHFCRGVHDLPTQINWASLAAPYLSSYSASQDASGSHDVFSRSHSSTPVRSRMSEIFFCPADDDRGARPVTSYEFKMWLAEGRPASMIPEPADMAMVWEQWAYHMDPHYSEYDRRAAINIGFVDGHTKWIRLSDTTSARFGNGPDLRWPFVGSGASSEYDGEDVAD